MRCRLFRRRTSPRPWTLFARGSGDGGGFRGTRDAARPGSSGRHEPFVFPKVVNGPVVSGHPNRWGVGSAASAVRPASAELNGLPEVSACWAVCDACKHCGGRVIEPDPHPTLARNVGGAGLWDDFVRPELGPWQPPVRVARVGAWRRFRGLGRRRIRAPWRLPPAAGARGAADLLPGRADLLMGRVAREAAGRSRGGPALPCAANDGRAATTTPACPS